MTVVDIMKNCFNVNLLNVFCSIFSICVLTHWSVCVRPRNETQEHEAVIRQWCLATSIGIKHVCNHRLYSSFCNLQMNTESVVELYRIRVPSELVSMRHLSNVGLPNSCCGWGFRIFPHYVQVSWQRPRSPSFISIPKRSHHPWLFPTQYRSRMVSIWDVRSSYLWLGYRMSWLRLSWISSVHPSNRRHTCSTWMTRWHFLNPSRLVLVWYQKRHDDHFLSPSRLVPVWYQKWHDDHFLSPSRLVPVWYQKW
jgi:hypothetical protein